MKYGLSEKQLGEIIDFIAQYPEVESAVLFGSRALGTYKEASDVDIALHGDKVNHALAAKMKFNIEEDTYLPFLFDFVAYPTITNDALRKHIDTKGVVIFRRGGGEWKEMALEEVAFINPSESLPKGSETKKVSMTDIQPFTKKITSYSIEPYSGGMKFRNGDTLVARITPCLENGKTAYVDILDDGEVGFGSTEYIVIREKPKVSDKHFLYYFAISSEFRDVAILSMTGSSGRQRVQTEVVTNHKFLLPSPPEQKAIASVLSSLDDKIDLLHRQNKTLEAMTKTLFRQWFVEEAEADWNDARLDEHADAYRGLCYTGSGLTVHGSGLPMHNLNSVYEGGGYKEAGIKFYSGEYKERHLVKPGEIIVANTEQGHEFKLIGYPAIVPPNFGGIGLFSQHIYRVVPKAESYVTSEFLYYLLMTPTVREQVISATNGSTVNMLAIDGLQRPEFKLPPQEKIFEFTQQASLWWKRTEINNSQIRTLEKLRDTLLPKLMSGEVRVAL